MKNSQVAAVLVTYNRLELLKKVLFSLKNQTKFIDKIIVINNGSTDGTTEWLESQSGIEIISQSNTGSSGGQARGFKEAYDQGYEWIWEMDDDVLPDENCLEIMWASRKENKVISPLRIAEDGNVFFNDTLEFNLSNPFKSFWKKIINENDISQDFIHAVGITFEGAFFHRSLIEKIGLPEKNIFIYGDDSEFFIRAVKAGFTVGILTKAIARRLLPYTIEKQIHSPKLYYIIRNQILIDRIHGSKSVRILRPIIYLIKWLIRSKSLNDINNTIKAFRDGWNYKPVYW